jgi:hypothetical protein
MLIGIYLLIAGVALLLGLVGLAMGVNPHKRWRNRGRRLTSYIVTSLIVSVVALGVFLLLSSLQGLYRLGTAQTVNFPADYLSAGTIGIVLFVIFVIGVLAPVLLALIFARPDKERW